MANLPKGLRIDHGYVQVRIQHRGMTYCKNFGLDCELARSLATIHLSEKRKEILLGRFGYAPELPSKTFSQVADIYYDIWSKEINPEGQPRHNPKSCRGVRRFIDGALKPFFGKMGFDSIKPRIVQEWRDKRLESILGTSANREQGVLSSIFSHAETWVKSEKIKPFKLPPENPCQFIEKAKIRKRERVLTSSELGLLKAACFAVNDPDIWDICKMALKSLLRKKDLMRLEAGQSIDLEQAKTGIRVQIPIQVLKPLNYVNFRKRWEAVKLSAQLPDLQFRDLRKTGANLLKQKNYSNKLISELLGHTNTRTTELYLVKDSQHLKPLADDLDKIIEGI